MESKRYSAWADLGVMAAILLGATIVAAVCITIVKIAVPGLGQGPLTFMAYTTQFVLAIAGSFVWLHRTGGRARLHMGTGWSHGPLILAGIVLATAAGIVIEPLLNLMPDHYLELLDDMIGRGGWAITTTVVAAPILEEIFFRGLLLESLARRWNARWAVVASAAVFGVMHLPILPQMVNAFAIALVMGYIYLQTRSLVPVIVIHAINNALAYMTLELTGTQSTDTRELIGNDSLYWIIYGVSAVVFVVALVIMDGKVRTKSTENTLNEKTADEI